MKLILMIKRFISGNLWSIPAAIALALLLLAPCLVIIEEFVSPQDLQMPQRSDLLLETARSLLAPMVTIFGIVLPLIFSFLLRSASQYSPMVLRIFRKQLLFKIFIGSMLGVILYLISLIAFTSFSALPSPPVLASMLGILLVLAALSSIPIMLDQFIKRIEPSFIANALAKDLKEMLSNLKLVDIEGDLDSLSPVQERLEIEEEKGKAQVLSEGPGYIIAINFEVLVHLVQSKNIEGSVPVRVGDFVISGHLLMLLSSTAAQVDQEFLEKCRDCFTIDISRGDMTDLELQLDELVNITVRALSPGINDLSTAIQCLDHIEEAVCTILNRRFNSGKFRDSSDKIRIRSRQFDFHGFIHEAFDRIRQNSESQAAIVIRVLQMLESLVRQSRNKERTSLLKSTARDFCSKRLKHHLIESDFQRIEELLERVVGQE